MPITVQVEGIAEPLEFPDSTPDEVIDRTVKKELLGLESKKAGKEMATADRFIGAVDKVTPFINAVSLGGMGKVAGALAKDILTAESPLGGIGIVVPPAQATSAQILGDPVPEDIQQNIQGNVVKSGLVKAAEMAPTVAAGAVLGGPVGMGTAMGASTLEETGSVAQAAKSAAIGAVLPYAARASGLAGAKLTADAVNRGATSLANPVVQKFVELGASQVPVQALLVGDLMQSDAYKAASPEEQNRMLVENLIANNVFAVPEAARLANPAVRPMARGFENNAVALSRALESAPVQEVASQKPGVEVTQQGWGVRPEPVVVPGLEASPLTAQAMQDALQIVETPGKGTAMGLLEAQFGEPSIVQPERVRAKEQVQGGRVSFSAEAPVLLRNAPEGAFGKESNAIQEQSPNEVGVRNAPAIREGMDAQNKASEVPSETSSQVAEPVTAEPLGIQRESKIDQSLKKLTDDEMYSLRKQRAKELDKLESILDTRELTRDERIRLGQLQDDWSSIELEKYRRDWKDVYEPDVFKELLDLFPLSNNSDKAAKASILLEILAKNGADENTLLSDIGSRLTNDQAEVLKWKLEELRNWAQKPIEPEQKGPANEKAQGNEVQKEVLSGTEQQATSGTERQMALVPGGREWLKKVNAAAAEASRRASLADEMAGGGEQKMRKLSARASRQTSLPSEVKDRVKKDPQSFYNQQVVADEAKRVQALSGDELNSDFNDPASKTSTLSALEIVRRTLGERSKALEAGDNELAAGLEKAAADIITRQSSKLTTAGQIINQAKELKGWAPEYNAIILNRILKSKGYDPLNTAQEKKLTDLSRKAIDTKAARMAADDAYKANPNAETWKAVSDSTIAEELATKDLNYYMARKHPRAFGDMLIAITQGNSMTPVSQVANVVGNVIAGTANASARAVGAAVDAVSARIGSKERTLSVYPIGEAQTRFKSLAHAAGVAKDIMVHGSDTAHIEAGQHGGVQLNSVRAWRDLKNIWLSESGLPTKGGKIPYFDRVKILMEASPFGISADVMLRGLGAMDAMFRYPERASLIYEFARRKGLPHEEAGRAVERPDLFLTKAEQDRIEFEASRSVYQQDNIATEMVANMNRTLKEKAPSLYPLARIGFSLFQKTPINVLAELVSWSPLGMAKIGSDLYKANSSRYKPTERKNARREAELQAAKIAIGSTAIAAGLWAYRKGIISAPMESSEDSQKARVGTGQVMPPGHINLTALKRGLSGGDTSPQGGDDIRDLRRLGLPGGLLYLSSMAARNADMKREDEPVPIYGLTAEAIPSVTQWAMNQTFLQGANDFLKSMTRDEGEKWFVSAMATAGNAISPNWLGSISKAIRDTKPEFKNDSAMTALANRMNEKWSALGFTVPGTQGPKELPPQIGPWGKPIPQHPPGSNPWVHSMLDLTNAGEIPEDPVNISLYNLWRRTLDPNVWPPIPDRQVSDKGQLSQNISYEQLAKRQEFVGQMRRRGVENVVPTEQFQLLGDADKIKVLKKIYEAGQDLGDEQFKQYLIERLEFLSPQKPRRGARPE